MSQESAEVVVGLIEAWNRGDRDGWLAGGHPEIEWSSGILRQVEGRDTIARGRAEMEAFWDEWHALWNLTIEASEVRDLGGTVLVLAKMRTQGKASGAAVERSIGYVFEFEDGLIRRAKAYLSSEEALEAVGLRE
jgi:ketosteroid isomerase-like protein